MITDARIRMVNAITPVNACNKNRLTAGVPCMKGPSPRTVNQMAMADTIMIAVDAPL
ncbi:Uncharacterised protein [uncultured archaeon]|nr:Uncharacterised protein [uncultured archaeon]